MYEQHICAEESDIKWHLNQVVKLCTTDVSLETYLNIQSQTGESPSKCFLKVSALNKTE